jgi:hypothetical protein
MLDGSIIQEWLQGYLSLYFPWFVSSVSNGIWTLFFVLFGRNTRLTNSVKLRNRKTKFELHHAHKTQNISDDSVILGNDDLSAGYITWRKGIFSCTAAKTSIFQVTYHQKQCRSTKNCASTVKILFKLSPGM